MSTTAFAMKLLWLIRTSNYFWAGANMLRSNKHVTSYQFSLNQSATCMEQIAQGERYVKTTYALGGG